MTRWLRDLQAALGRTGMIAAFAALVAGIVGFATGLGDDDAPRTYGALIASWLFFAGLAAGAIAFRAFFRIVDAKWTRPLASLGGAMIAFAPIALGVLVVIVAGAGSWLHAAESSWMSFAALAIRELGLTLALFGCGFLLRPRAEREGGPPRALAVLYCLVFPTVVSIWAFDFVLGADAVFESTMIGVFVFMGAFIAATGLVTLLAVARGILPERARRDVAGLVLALAIFWVYLFWSQYLTIWYGNLPDEVGFALRRIEGGWGVVVLAVLGLVFVLPFVMLLHPAGRRSSRLLGALVGLQLVGFWLVCQLLIVPSLSPVTEHALGIRDVLITLGLLGAFVLSVAPGVKTATTNLEKRSL